MTRATPRARAFSQQAGGIQPNGLPRPWRGEVSEPSGSGAPDGSLYYYIRVSVQAVQKRYAACAVSAVTGVS